MYTKSDIVTEYKNVDLKTFCCGHLVHSFCVVVLYDFMCILYVLPLA